MRRSRNYILFVSAALFAFIPRISTAQDTLYLDNAIRTGLENSYSIQIARNNVEIASNNDAIGNAGMLPRFDLGVNQSSSFPERFYQYADESTELSNFPTHSLSSVAQLNWTVFDGFAMFIRKEKLQLYHEQSDLYLRMEVENTIADIVFTYYSIAVNRKLLQSFEEQMALSRQRLMVAQEKSKIGVGYGLQVLQAEVDFRADSAQYIRQCNRLVNLKADLNRLLNRKPETHFFVDDQIPVPQQGDINEIYRKVAEDNPSMLNARLQTRLGELEYNEAKSARYPSVNISGAYNFSRIGTPEGQMLVSRSHGPVVGIGASVSLFNGFNANRQIKNAQIIAENHQLNQEDIALRLRSTAFKLVNELNIAIDLVRVEEQSVILAHRNTEAAWERFQLGAISDLELRETQKKLLDAQTRLISAQMSAQAAEIDLKSLTGDMGQFLGN